VAKLPRPHVSSSLVLGGSIHKALAEFHRQLHAGTPLPLAQVQQVFLDSWTESEAAGPIQFREKETRDQALQQGQALLDLYLKEPPPEKILAVEQEFLVPLYTSQGEVLEKPLMAVPDLICQGENRLLVKEFKTSGRRFSELETDGLMQASCYVHAVQERLGGPVAVRYVVLVKTKTPQIQCLDTVRDEADIGRIGDIAQAIQRVIEAGVFYPIESPMNCSSCPFFKPCREWKGAASVPVADKAENEAVLC
jgi:CRISPR/Cas system-associated exonuclease Cas4 (RecB family)